MKNNACRDLPYDAVIPTYVVTKKLIAELVFNEISQFRHPNKGKIVLYRFHLFTVNLDDI